MKNKKRVVSLIIGIIVVGVIIAFFIWLYNGSTFGKEWKCDETRLSFEMNFPNNSVIEAWNICSNGSIKPETYYSCRDAGEDLNFYDISAIDLDRGYCIGYSEDSVVNDCDDIIRTEIKAIKKTNCRWE